MTIKDASKAF